MSRTDKTKPFRVKALHADLCFREAHDHSRGECDLPALNAHTPFGVPGGRCRRVFRYTCLLYTSDAADDAPRV